MSSEQAGGLCLPHHCEASDETETSGGGESTEWRGGGLEWRCGAGTCSSRISLLIRSHRAETRDSRRGRLEDVGGVLGSVRTTHEQDTWDFGAESSEMILLQVQELGRSQQDWGLQNLWFCWLGSVGFWLLQALMDFDRRSAWLALPGRFSESGVSGKSCPAS